MTTSTDKIKKQIAALLAKAEGTDNEFEAATFMAKVNQLLEKYQLEMHDIRQATTDNDPMGMKVGETNIYASMLWARDVAGPLARYYNCRIVYRRRGNHIQYDVVGRESARITFELMLPFVITQVKLQAKRLGLNSTKSKSVLEREVGHALMIRLWDLVTVAEKSRATLVGKGLIPVSDLDAAMADIYPNGVRKAKGRAVSFGHDAAAAAEKVSLHHQATGTGRTKLLGN